MKRIDVDGLPDDVAQAIERIVIAFRAHALGVADGPRPRVEIPRWPGRVLGRLTRDEIYFTRIDGITVIHEP